MYLIENYIKYLSIAIDNNAEAFNNYCKYVERIEYY